MRENNSSSALRKKMLGRWLPCAASHSGPSPGRGRNHPFSSGPSQTCAFGSSLTPAFAHTDAFPMQTGNDLSHVIPHPLGGGGASHFTPNASQGSRTWSFREPQGFAVTALMSDFCFEGRLRNTAFPGTGSEDHQAGLSPLPENLLPPRWSPPGPASWAPWGWPQTANSRAQLTHSHRLGTPKLGLGVQIWRQHLSGIRERPASGLHVRTQEMAHGHLPLPSQETQGQGLDSMPREALAGVRAPQD